MLGVHGTALFLAAPLLAAQEPTRARRDSTPVDSLRRIQLPAVVVTVSRSPERQDRLPVALGVVDGTELAGPRPTIALDDALAGIPGVHVANRYNFSLDQRLSIRGFGSRANFGTRGVRILLDGVPQTLPDGQSQLTNIEFADLARIEVLRGAASALYGNASGGVVALYTVRPGALPFAHALRLEGGSFGSLKWHARTSARRGSVAGAMTLSRFTTDGFRQHSAADFRQLTGQIEVTFSPRTLATLRLGLADQPRADNPGALTAAELAARRDTAAPLNVARRAGKAVRQQQLALQFRRIGVGGGATEYGVAIFGLLRDLENPLATGTFVTIDRGVVGLRLDASRAPFTVGLDVQRMRDDRVNALAVDGRPTDSVVVAQRERVSEIGPFVQLRWSPPPVPRLLLQLGARYDRVTFAVTDRHLSDGEDDSDERALAAWSGHLGVSLDLARAFVPYANVATAFETPTTTELANRPDGTGGFNPDLGPQRAVSWELGARGEARHVAYSVAVFTGRVRDAIVQFEEVGGRAYFRNAGRVRQGGVEVGLTACPLPGLAVRGAYTYADHRFADYRIVQGTVVDTLDGNRLPGVPRHFAELGVRIEAGGGWSLGVDHAISSSVWADDDNAILVDAWGGGARG